MPGVAGHYDPPRVFDPLAGLTHVESLLTEMIVSGDLEPDDELIEQARVRLTAEVEEERRLRREDPDSD